MGTTLVPLAGEKSVTATGTAEALSATKLLVSSYVVRAKAGNTNQVYLGDSSVDVNVNDGLDASETFSWEAHGLWGKVDLAGVFIDVDTNGEGVDFFYTPYKPST